MLGLEHPVWLWALGAVPIVVYVALRWFGTMSLSRRWSAAIARIALIALIAGILGGATLVRPTERLAVIALVDISESVRTFASSGGASPTGALDMVRAFLDSQRDTENPEDLLGVVAFAGRPAALALPRPPADLDVPLDVPLPPGTNLAAALRFASSLVPPDAAGRIVLFSDGVQTSGDALDAAADLAGVSGAGETRRGGIPVDVAAFRYAIEREVVVESVDAPPRAPADAPITLRITLRAASPAEGTLRLLHNEEPVDIDPQTRGDGRRVALERGLNVELARVRLDGGRVHRFEAIFEPSVRPDGSLTGDSVLRNNRAEAFTIASGRGSVLIVEGAGHGAGECPLETTLRESGLDVTRLRAESFPDSLLALQSHDLVILENVPADAIPRRSHEDLANHVRGMGAGLVMVGGRSSFGAGGWKGTAVEPLLPVRLDLPESLVLPETAVLFVLDNSGSMNRSVLGSTRTQQAIANDSTALAILSLDEQDLVGVIAFNSTPEVIVPLGPNRDPPASAELVRAIPSGGGTNLGPALREAGRQLDGARAKVKHVIVLSDGRSQDAESLPPLAESLASRGIILSTISVGDEADREGLGRLAAIGGGAHYEVVNPAVLPRLLVRAVRILRSPMVREGRFEPASVGVASPLLDGLGDIPALGGISLTQRRTEPTVTTPLLHPEGEPVLAHHPVELGRVVAFTSDAHHWAREWLDWGGYQTFWSRTARWAARPGDSGEFVLTTRRDGDRLTLRLDAADPAIMTEGTSVRGAVYSPSGEPINAPFVRTGPGSFETVVAAPEPGNYIAVVKPRLGDRPLPPVIGGTSVAAGPELRRLESDEVLLERIARLTGGRVLDITDPRSARLFDRSGLEPVRARTPIWRALLIWAVVVLMLDVGTRRVAWDRLLSRDFGADLRRAAREQLEDRSARASATLRTIREKSRRAETGGKAILDEEIERLRQEQKARRRERRAAELRARFEARGDDPSPGASARGSAPAHPPGARTAPDDRGEGSDDAEHDRTSGLLEAKRRARRRFVDEEDSTDRGE